MCQHHYEIDLRPAEDPDIWQDIDAVPMDGGRHLAEDERERGLATARGLARDYALAYPERAQYIHVTRWTCCGPEEEEAPFPDGIAIADGADTQRLARESMRLRAALKYYADPSAWRLHIIGRRQEPASMADIEFPSILAALNALRDLLRAGTQDGEIGRASCRERV